jgi:hypothetical protein
MAVIIGITVHNNEQGLTAADNQILAVFILYGLVTKNASFWLVAIFDILDAPGRPENPLVLF